MAKYIAEHEIRGRFSEAMSAMYRTEVPKYGTLLDIVAEVNKRVLHENAELRRELALTEQIDRLSVERHGAIRLGTAEELSTMRRLFSVMGMSAVGYYDLAPAGVPVHATAFRAVDGESLNRSPFRVFTSLLRLDLIDDPALRRFAAVTLGRRKIFTGRVLQLIAKREADGGLNADDAAEFVKEALETFRWHSSATISEQDYRRLVSVHRLVADVVSFRGPHINHLTPRTLDIDAVQDEMRRRQINPKAVVEGPPRRRCPILLRQTSFKALEEPIQFTGEDGRLVMGAHTARFGEIEQRGAALTPEGRAQYDQLLAKAQRKAAPLPDGSNSAEYGDALAQAFSDFPDDYGTMRERRLAYFRYGLADAAKVSALDAGAALDLQGLVRNGVLSAEPIVYEDFLPVSAAGIFQSNLGEEERIGTASVGARGQFEDALGARVADEFRLYRQAEASSIAACERALGRRIGEP